MSDRIAALKAKNADLRTEVERLTEQVHQGAHMLVYAKECEAKVATLEESLDLARKKIVDLSRLHYEDGELHLADEQTIRNLEAKLARVHGLLEPRSVGRIPECTLCSVCRAMLLAAFAEPEDTHEPQPL